MSRKISDSGGSKTPVGRPSKLSMLPVKSESFTKSPMMKVDEEYEASSHSVSSSSDSSRYN